MDYFYRIYRLIYQYWYCATSTVGILDLVVSRSIFVNLAVAPGNLDWSKPENEWWMSEWSVWVSESGV